MLQNLPAKQLRCSQPVFLKDKNEKIKMWSQVIVLRGNICLQTKRVSCELTRSFNYLDEVSRKASFLARVYKELAPATHKI